jgi:hypothetical protein
MADGVQEWLAGQDAAFFWFDPEIFLKVNLIMDEVL